MSLIAMCVHCTDQNKRIEYAKRSIASLLSTVDLTRHRLFLISNASSSETVDFLRTIVNENADKKITLIILSENVGTSRGINHAMFHRAQNEHFIKADEDVIWNQPGWVDELECAIEKEPTIGILGLKRKDLRQTPTDPDPNFRSILTMLPHNVGEKWKIIEETNDIIGTCTMFNSKLIDAIGYSWQPSIYGFEDNLYSLRSRLAGFKNAFLPTIDIDHIDEGNTSYAGEKMEIANSAWQSYQQAHIEYCNGTRNIYFDGGF